MTALYIFHKSPRLFMLERRVWLAGRTYGSGGKSEDFTKKQYVESGGKLKVVSVRVMRGMSTL